VWERRKGRDVERAVRRAAFEGRLPGERGLPSMPPLFKLGTDPKSKRPRWMPTAACLQNQTLYEKTRKALGGVHLVENALWRARHYDYLMQVHVEGQSSNQSKSAHRESPLSRPGRTPCTATNTESAA